MNEGIYNYTLLKVQFIYQLIFNFTKWLSGVRQHVFFQTLAQSALAICWGKAQDQRTEISSELRCPRRHRKGTRQAPRRTGGATAQKCVLQTAQESSRDRH